MHVRTCARTRSQEFARGVKYLNFVPPIIIDEEDWHAEVVDRNFTVECKNGIHRIGKEGEVVYVHCELRKWTVSLRSLSEPLIALSPLLFSHSRGHSNAEVMWCDVQ
jgi:hypothetical protein